VQLHVVRHKHAQLKLKRKRPRFAVSQAGLHRRAPLLDRQVKRKTETLFPANLMLLKHHHGDRQWCKCAAAHRIGLHRFSTAKSTAKLRRCFLQI
jgi:hypothetical protein